MESGGRSKFLMYTYRIFCIRKTDGIVNNKKNFFQNILYNIYVLLTPNLPYAIIISVLE